MKPWNKDNLISGLVILAIAVVIFATIIVIYGFIKSGEAIVALIPTLAAVVYACIVFFKKYYPNDKKDYAKD